MIETLTITQWITICLSAVLIGMSKTGIQGITALTVPYMAIAFGAKESTGIILPMLCMADIIAVFYFRKKADCSLLRQPAFLSPSGLIIRFPPLDSCLA